MGMSDVQTSAPKRVPSGLYEHWCEHPGCKKDGASPLASRHRTGSATSTGPTAKSTLLEANEHLVQLLQALGTH